jgi:thiol-disulfide isomerase/thioredoxin
MRRMIAAGPPAKRPPHNRFAGVSVEGSGAGRGLSRLMTRCRRLVAALVLVASTLGSTAILAAEPDKITLGEFIPAAPPQPAPQISVTDMTGNTVAIGDFKGKFLVVNLWATWCQPCLQEMPSLEALQAKLGPALTVLAISEDRGGADAVKPFIEKLGLDKVQVYLDPKSTAIKAVGARGLPTSIVVDADGMVLGKVEGAANWVSDEMLSARKKLMPVNSPAR